MQQITQPKPAVGIIVDTDLGNGIDDALALALLYGLDGKNEIRFVAISVSKPNLNSAAFAEVIGRFYAGAVSGAFNAVGRTLPVALALKGAHPEDTPMLTEPLAKKKADGQPAYSHGLQRILDTAEVGATLRNALTGQHDQNAIVLMLGPATNLVTLLDVPGAKDWISRKVRFLAIMGGDYSGGGPEFNIKSDIPAARRLFAEWPTPIVASGYEVGKELLYPAASIEKDFAWSESHPVVDAYRAYKAMPYDAPTWDMTAALYAARPDAGFFKLSEPGTISVAEDGRTTFAAGSNGKHRHLIFDPAQKEKIIQTYIELASAKPVVRAPRRRPNQQQDMPKPPAAPPAGTPPSAPATQEVKPPPPPPPPAGDN